MQATKTYIIMPLLILFASLLLLQLPSLNHANNIITSSCTATLYPEICYSTLSDHTLNIATKKDVIELTINKTKDAIQASFRTMTDLCSTNTPNILTKRAKMALLDCLDMEAATLDQLDTVIHYLREYPTRGKPDLAAGHLRTLMSTTITNKQTCLDGLISLYDDIPKLIIKGHRYGGKMCSNVLAMIKNITDHIASSSPAGGGRNERIMWPEWLSAGNRKLLWFGGVKPDIIVAKNGKGNYTTVEAAVDAVPHKSTRRYVIKITAGTYNENIHIPTSKHNIMFLGDGRDKTIITGNKNVAADDGTTTITSATVAVLGERFLARGITFENTAGASGHQAVALRVGSDLSAFYECGFEGYQDTLYVHSNRQFYVKCLVTGTIDFIFGNAAAIFQFCDIMVRKPNPGQGNMVTAQGRTDINQDTGIVIHRCNIGATPELKAVQKDFSTYLGRPWKKYSRTVVMGSVINDVINKEGWCPWNDTDFALDTLYYREYQNMGPGSDTSKRVTWKGWGVIKDANEARPFTVARFINGWDWLLSTGFPFWPAVLGEGFLARGITFENTAGASGHQAVALLVGSDLSAFYECGFEGYQDTLYVHSNRQFYIKCLVTGTIDFIFGNAAAIFQLCDIMVRKPNPDQSNVVTAQGRTDINQDTGIVIHKCNIGATPELKAVQKDFATYLGRPWKKYSRTVVMGSVISDVLKKEGWCPWNDTDFALDTLYYREYQNTGPGSDMSKRVTWKGWGVIKDANEAKPFTIERFINGQDWLLSTGFPFYPGL